jgi:hypothetical protein
MIRRRLAAIHWAIIHALAVTGSFIWTLALLHNNDTVDGLEYSLLIPLAFPWSILPVRGHGIYADAVLLAIMGFANSGLLYIWLTRKLRT